MFHFCTYFNKNYLSRGIALFESLLKTCDDFKLYVVCLDDVSFDVVSEIGEKNSKLVALPLFEIETWDGDLLKIKHTRSLIEYYFTLSPIIPLYILDKYEDVDIITYLDADLFFYSSPECLYIELGNNSILAIEHRFPTHRKHKEKFGRFNVQYLSFRKDEQGIACLTRWRKQCIEWCYDRLEEGKYADQKYLDEWPVLYKNMVASENKGAGLAPWNVDGYNIKIDKDCLYVDSEKLVFYHYHGLRQLSKRIMMTGLSLNKVKIQREIVNWLYKRYVRELQNSEQSISNLVGTMENVSVYVNVRRSRSKVIEIAKALVRRDILFV